MDGQAFGPADRGAHTVRPTQEQFRSLAVRTAPEARSLAGSEHGSVQGHSRKSHLQ